MNVMYAVCKTHLNALNEQEITQKQNLYHVRHVPNDVKTLEDLCFEICDASSFTESDVIGVVDALVYRIGYHIQNGDCVRINGLGLFYPILSSTKAIKNPEESINTHIRFKKMGFKLSVRLRNQMQLMKFNRLPGIKGIPFNANERPARIMSLFDTNTFITTEMCCSINRCSRMTASRDLKRLQQTGKIGLYGNGKSVIFMPLKKQSEYISDQVKH